MKTESALRVEAMQLLIKNLGEVDAERFISLVNREQFDYTEWQCSPWAGKDIHEVYDAAKSFYESNPS